MEIKITCSCGTKFSFEVEPVHGRMPAPVNCPSCGADKTAQANDYIRQTLEGPPSSPPVPAPAPVPARPPAPIRVNVPLPTASPAGSTPPAIPAQAPEPIRASAPPPPPAPSLRINRPAGHTPQSQSQDAAETHQQPPVPVAAPRRIAPAARPDGEPKNKVVQVLILVGSVAVIVFGAWAFGDKWLRRIKVVSDIATVAGAVSVGSDSDKSEESGGAKNLWYDNCSMLFIRASNHLQVAEAAQQYWKDKWNKRVMLINTPREMEETGEYELISPHNGWVRIIGAHEWPLAELEGLAQHLSQKFGTLAFEWRSESFADTYHFGVYDQGARKFHAQMDIKNEADEVVTTTGNDFAIANGFKPGKEGFKEFNVLDADKITQHMGMKLWDESDGKEIKGAILKEVGTGAREVKSAE